MSLTRRAAFAAPAMLLGTVAFAADPAAAAPIQALLQGIVAGMKAGKATPFQQRYLALAPIVERAFDLPAVLASSVGPRLPSLPADQQASLLDLFKKFTVASYVANFDNFGGERFDLVPEQRAVGPDLVVGTRLVPTRGDTIAIDYVMHQGSQGWRAIDVLLNGSISQNAVKRSDFRSLVTATSAQPLVDSLRRKVAELSGGVLT